MLTLSSAKIVSPMPDHITLGLLHANPTEEARDLLDKMELDVYIIDAPYISGVDTYGVIRNNRFPFMYQIHPITVEVMERRMKEIYPLYDDQEIIDGDALLNGIRDLDETVIDVCMKNAAINCRETDDGKLTYGTHVWDGETELEEWLRPFIVPLITDIEDGNGVLQAMIMFPRQLILFNDFNTTYLEKIASHVREHVAVFSGPTNHTLMERYNVTGTSAVLIYMENVEFAHKVFEGEITLENLKDFVARI